MLHNVSSRCIFFALLMSSLITFSACDRKHDDVIFDNPFSYNNLETQGDPFDLRAKIREDNTVLISWNKVQNIDGVALCRRGPSDANFEIISLSDSGEYIDKDIKPDKTYYYQLRAHKWGMAVATSDIVTAVSNKISYMSPISKDRAPMVLIPSGEFQMGSNSMANDAKPVHTVYLDAFYIDVYEVTNNQYAKFMRDTSHEAPAYWDDPIFGLSNRPVVGVSLRDAQDYCKWAGERLPTEAEWEKAARGGLSARSYPWEGEISHRHANYYGIGIGDIYDSITAPVGSFPPNGYGLYDMSGNVSEWCSDWYDDNYYKISPRINPTGPTWGKNSVIRGGSWGDSAICLRVASRSFGRPNYIDSKIGFRCCVSR